MRSREQAPELCGQGCPVVCGDDSPGGRVVRFEVSEEWFSRRYVNPSEIEGLSERESSPVLKSSEEQLSRARIVSLSGLDEWAITA